MKDTKPKILKASLIAPLAVLLIPTIASLAIIYSDSTSELDDAPKRASMAFIYFLLPLFYIVIFAVMSLGSLLLLKTGYLKRTILLFCVGLLSLSYGIAMSQQNPFGAADQLISFFIFSGVSFVCSALGVFVWWHLAFSRHNKSLTQIGAKDAPPG